MCGVHPVQVQKYQPHQQSSTTKVGEGVKINTISGGYNGWYQGVFGVRVPLALLPHPSCNSDDLMPTG
jgi:hypothetical protein